jgi:hypothetical protein
MADITSACKVALAGLDGDVLEYIISSISDDAETVTNLRAAILKLFKGSPRGGVPHAGPLLAPRRGPPLGPSPDRERKVP